MQQTSGQADLSTSPDGTFTHATYSCHRKQSMVTNLLPEINSAESSFDDANVFNRSNNNVEKLTDDDTDNCKDSTKAANNQKPSCTYFARLFSNVRSIQQQ